MVGRRGLFLLLLSLLFIACDRDPVVLTVKPDVVEKGDTARRTLLVYMMAENSLSRYAALDVAEIVEAVPSVPNDCRLFVYTDDIGFPILTQYFNMTDGSVGNSNYHPFDKDVCSSDTAALGKVLDLILKDYPTESLDIVMWSHGNGWLRVPSNSTPQRSIGIDNDCNSYSNNVTVSIEMEELAALLKRLPTRVDRLMFDACFMQCVEVAYALRDAAEWIIASPAEIPGDGALYSTMVPEFFLSDGPEGIIDSYIKAYENEYAGAVLSAVRTSGMQHLADVTYAYVIKYFNTDKTREYSALFSYLPGGGGDGNGVIYPYYYDMNSVMKRYLDAEEYKHWRSAFDGAVTYLSASATWYSAIRGRKLWFDVESGSGISVYMPQRRSMNESLNANFRTTEWYSAAGWQAAGW